MFFLNNIADEGGAIVFDSLRSFVNDSDFIGNIGRVSAGALATTNAVDTLANANNGVFVFPLFSTTVRNSTFKNNVAEGDLAAHNAMFGGPNASGIDFPLGGGALVAYVNGFLDVFDSTFIGNRAENGPGGAILNGNSSAKNFFGFPGLDAYIVKTIVTNSCFFDNIAAQTSDVSPNILGNGGAIASLPGSFFDIPEITIADTALTVKDSEFKSNFAGGNGGAIYLKRTLATLIKNCFERNRAILLGDNIFAIDSIIKGIPEEMLAEMVDSLEAVCPAISH